MSVHHVSGQRTSLGKTTEALTTLRPGQIIQGKILKIYPDNKAQIQLGSRQMVAQLEASLSVGGKYHLQVQSSERLVHLKVIGDQLTNQTETNIQRLMHHLGLKATKSTNAFMQTLVDERIPFEKGQLTKAFQFLHESNNKTQAQQVLKEMIVNKLPVTESIFQALHTKSTNGFSVQMRSLLQPLTQDMNQTPLHQNMINRLNQLTESFLTSKASLVKEIISEVSSNNQSFFNGLKASGAINSSMEFSQWKTGWERFMKQHSIQSSTVSNQQITHVKLPFQMDETQVMQRLKYMINHKAEIRADAQALTQKWSNVINQTAANNRNLSAQLFSKLQQDISQKVMPLISNQQQQRGNNPASLRQLQTMLQTMANEPTFTKIEQFIANAKQGEALFSASPREQFLTQVRNVLQLTGLTHENAIAQDIKQNQVNTIKSMLIQMAQQGEGMTQERSGQLLHFINGMQLQSVNESSNFMQASLQIPGEKLGLNSDVDLEFEGKKTENGEINPDYCRILFYLNLANLKETVIDMNVQKRTVAITILSEKVEQLENTAPLKKLLKEGLERLNYQLSTITYKPYQQQANDSKKNTVLKAYQSSYQGVDYRI
ncbi:hypothetical protein ACFQ3N_06225 [Virgibacillus byunsanensis]|uniref:Flagellar hook-length control protein-like C-terminal domain-containing protein n=1 Tax=Virgibacillus byunsanensis TaxID=570945 RepID=A0ABW3LHZ0_9BACI